MLTKESTGLIIVDIQGKLARLVYEADHFIANCAKLIKGAQALGLPIIWLEQNPEKLGATVDELACLLNKVKPISKFTFNACDEPEFLAAIEKVAVGNWLICGIEAHICVYQTALNLKQKGLNVQLVIDCISARTLSNKTLAINKLTNLDVDITGLEMSLYELVKDCRADSFKNILKLIK